MTTPVPVSQKREIGRFIKHSGIYAIGNVLNRAGALLLLPIYTTHLSVAQYGTLELFYVIATVLSGVLSAGLAHATLRFYFEYPDERDRNAVVSTNLILSTLLVGGGALLVAIWHEPISARLVGTPDMGNAMLIVLATMVLELSSQICLAYLRARELSLFFVGLALIKLLIQCGANAWLVIVMKAGVTGVLFGNLLAVAAGWAVLIVFTLRHCGVRFDRSKAGPILAYSFPFLLSMLLGIVYSQADRLMINAFLTLEALGLYALALKFSGLMDQLIGEPFNRSYGAFRFSVMDRADASEIQSRIVRYLGAGTICFGLGVALYTPDLLKIIAQPAYWPAAEILPLLVVAALLNVLVYPLQTGILFHKKTGHLFQINLAATVFGLAVNFLLIRSHGLMGACVAQILTAALIAAMTWHISRRYFPVVYQWRPLVLLVMAAVMAVLLSRSLPDLSSAASISAHTGIYLAFLLLLPVTGAVTSHEIAGLRSWLLGRLSRAPS